LQEKPCNGYKNLKVWAKISDSFLKWNNKNKAISKATPVLVLPGLAFDEEEAYLACPNSDSFKPIQSIF